MLFFVLSHDLRNKRNIDQVVIQVLTISTSINKKEVTGLFLFFISMTFRSHTETFLLRNRYNL